MTNKNYSAPTQQGEDTQVCAEQMDQQQAAQDQSRELGGFDTLGLRSRVLAAVADMGYTEPTPVQKLAIPEVLAGRDVLAAAQTGTGKTAAFLLPAMSMLSRGGRRAKPKMLVVTPTRELAQQIDGCARSIARRTRHATLTVVGGLSYNPQIAGLRRGVDVLVATPGRLVDLIEQGACQLDGVELLVLDEADRMLDMGFLPAVRTIVNELPQERQTLLFSATLDDKAIGAIKDLVHEPARVEIAPENTPADTVDQFVLPIDQRKKSEALINILDAYGPERTIVFARTKRRADSVVEKLQDAGISAAPIHGDCSQAARQRALNSFKVGKVNVLVATDVLARGIDVSEVRYVVNFDIPDEPVDYIHRIGRTGRAGERGWAITMVTQRDLYDFYEIEKMMNVRTEMFDAERLDIDCGNNKPKLDPERDPAKGGRGGSKSKSKSKAKSFRSSRPSRQKSAEKTVDCGCDQGACEIEKSDKYGDDLRHSRPRRNKNARKGDAAYANKDQRDRKQSGSKKQAPTHKRKQHADEGASKAERYDKNTRRERPSDSLIDNAEGMSERHSNRKDNQRRSSQRSGERKGSQRFNRDGERKNENRSADRNNAQRKNNRAHSEGDFERNERRSRNTQKRASEPNHTNRAHKNNANRNARSAQKNGYKSNRANYSMNAKAGKGASRRRPGDKGGARAKH